LWLAVPAASAYQATPASVVITAVDASAFPDMRVQVAVRGAQGRNVTGLSASAFTLAENGAPVPALSVSEAEVGVQVAFVIATDDMFLKRDSTGTSRLSYIQQAVGEFLVGRPWMQDEADDVSILVPEGPLVLHNSSGAAVQEAFEGYAPPPQAPPQEGSAVLTMVANAVEAAEPVGPSQGRPAAVVLFATGLSNVTPDQIDLAASQARALSVPIFAVNVSPPLEPEAVNARNLRQLAEVSGGQMMYFDSSEDAVPAFEAIDSQRTQYLLAYRSTLAVSGQPALSVQVKLPEAGGEAVTSEPVNFALSVSPPQVTVTGLPGQILREPQAEGEALASGFRDHPLQVNISFPDGHDRGVRRLRLLVDGEMVAEISKPPFGQVILKAAELQETGLHTVEVEVTDELGLSTVSVPLQVTVRDVETEAAPAEAAPAAAPAGSPLVAAAGGVLALLVLGAGGFVLARRSGWLGGLSAFADREEAAKPEAARVPAIRRAPAAPALGSTQPMPPPIPKPGALQAANNHKEAVLTVEQPAEDEREPAEAREPIVPRLAYLEVIQVSEGSRTPIDLTGAPVSLGRDPALAAITFADRSVSRLHARIAIDEQGAYHIYDEGSTSGTWVNYEQVTAAGRALRQGDLINLGRIQLRFRLRAAVAPVRPGAGGARQGQRPPDDTTIPFKPKRRPWDKLK
jgi:hypothetical protein